MIKNSIIVLQLQLFKFKCCNRTIYRKMINKFQMLFSISFTDVSLNFKTKKLNFEKNDPIVLCDFFVSIMQI